LRRSFTVHTTALRSHDFRIEIDRAPAAVPDVFPGFDEHDRLGIVITSDDGARGAATLILATVTAFYDRLRAAGRPSFAYADYFAFHVGDRHGDLRKLDVWPPHKEVVVPAEAEAVLQAINDRGVTRLLVPDGPPGPPSLARETRESAERRIAGALAYAPAGTVADAEVTVSGSPASAGFITQMLDSTGAADPRPADAETFRRLPLEAALGLLAPAPR
jgi:hypothetical protein